jgi:hypothetical protein
MSIYIAIYKIYKPIFLLTSENSLEDRNTHKTRKTGLRRTRNQDKQTVKNAVRKIDRKVKIQPIKKKLHSSSTLLIKSLLEKNAQIAQSTQNVPSVSNRNDF